MNFRYSIQPALWAATLLFTGGTLSAQQHFTIVKSIPVTPVKDQHRTGTCWCFATTSFLEAELIRTGQGEQDLSEMYFVRKGYEHKADKYVRMQGKTNFGNGGLAMDVMYIIKSDGMVPETAYSGQPFGETLPVHGEMDAVLNGYVEQVIKNENGLLSKAWKAGFAGVLDGYLGKVPASFEYQGESHTPRSFADKLKLNPDDYLAVGSYTHHPFYESFMIEIPDNWLWNSIENVPLDEMMKILDHALETGYTVCWDADVGQEGFGWKTGVAMIPVCDKRELSEEDLAKWEGLTEQERRKQFYDFFSPEKETVITQELRQEWFDNYKTTDDHLMHITGTASNQDGQKFYRVKNSWGSEDHIYGGYLYVSESYMRAQTIFFMVHRDAIPRSIADKMGL